MCSPEKRMARFFCPLALMLMDADCPAVQVVPAATCMIADQVPLAHCWNEVPPMQFHSPSVVQGLPAVCAPTAPVVPVLAGGAAEATDEATGAEPLDEAGAAEAVDDA